MKKLFVFVAVIVLSLPVFAQRGEFGPLLGAVYYVGDINPGMPFSSANVAYGALYRYNFNQRWTLRGTFLRGDLDNSDLTAGNTPEREWTFSSTVNEISTQMEVNFLPYITGGTHNFFSPYLFGGVALLFGNGNSNQGGYNILVPSMPFGMGFKLSLSKRFCLGGEWGYRKTMSDNLDDLPHLNSDGSRLSNSQNNDWYSFAGLTLTYSLRLEDPKRCTDFQNRFGY
jgi:hypothetical protein